MQPGFRARAAIGCATVLLLGASVAVGRRAAGETNFVERTSWETAAPIAPAVTPEGGEDIEGLDAEVADLLFGEGGSFSNSSDGGLQWYVTNKYTDALAKPIGLQYDWVHDGVQVIDPFYEAQLGVSNVAGGGDMGSWQFEWALDCDDGSTFRSTEKAPTVTFKAVADCNLTVAASDEGGAPQGNTTGVLKVRYVRRELRELTKEDRTLWLDSLAQMWWVDGDTGREKYGADFVSSNELLAIHATNSALRDNDHFHNGAGFLAQHVRLDDMVMKSLQTMNPSIASPYWDWTIESRMLELGTIESPFDTPLWTADWFGSLNYVENPSTVGAHYGVSLEEFMDRGMEAWAIRDGRWKYATVQHMSEAKGSKFPINSYGFLRSPWNNNPSPFVTRINFKYNTTAAKSSSATFKAWPSCADLYDFIHPRHGRDENVSAVWFMTHLEDMTIHANVHQALGGTVLDSMTTEAMVDGIEAANATGGKCYQTVAERHVWRSYLADMAQGCDPYNAATPDAIRACQLDCSHADADRLAAIGSFAISQYACESESNLGQSNTSLYSSLVKQAVGELMCGLTFIKGEHLEASGTTDPSFFIVHPTLARYYQLKKLMDTNVLVDDWASVDGRIDACVPAIGACFDSLGHRSSAEDCCAGHFRYSTYFLDMYRTHAPGALSNEALVTMVDPDNDDKDALIFHHLDWSHCDENFASLPRTNPDKKMYWLDFFARSSTVNENALAAHLDQVNLAFEMDPTNHTVPLPPPSSGTLNSLAANQTDSTASESNEGVKVSKRQDAPRFAKDGGSSNAS